MAAIGYGVGKSRCSDALTQIERHTTQERLRLEEQVGKITMALHASEERARSATRRAVTAETVRTAVELKQAAHTWADERRWAQLRVGLAVENARVPLGDPSQIAKPNNQLEYSYYGTGRRKSPSSLSLR